MAMRIELQPGEPEVLQLVLSYMSRRFFDPSDSDRLLETETQLEEARRQMAGSRKATLVLETDEVATMLRALSSYIEEFDRPTSGADREQLRVIHRFGARLQRRQGLWGRLLARLGLR